MSHRMASHPPARLLWWTIKVKKAWRFIAIALPRALERHRLHVPAAHLRSGDRDRGYPQYVAFSQHLPESQHGGFVLCWTEYTQLNSEVVSTSITLPYVTVTSVATSQDRWSAGGGASFDWKGGTPASEPVGRARSRWGGLLTAVDLTSGIGAVRRQLTRNSTLEVERSTRQPCHRRGCNDHLRRRQNGFGQPLWTRQSAGVSRQRWVFARLSATNGGGAARAKYKSQSRLDHDRISLFPALGAIDYDRRI